MFTFPLILLIHVFVLSSLCVFISVNVLFPISVRLLLRSTPLHWHSFKRSRKHDCHNINLLPGLIVASCRLSAALVVSLKQTKKKRGCGRDSPPSLLGSLPADETLSDPQLCKSTKKTMWRSIYYSEWQTEWHYREATKLGLALTMAAHQALELHWAGVQRGSSVARGKTQRRAIC